jgi:hypothetical protein
MEYIYKYPNKVQNINGRRCGRININESHLAQLHEELINRLDTPAHTIAVRAEFAATPDRIWEVAAPSIGAYFAHHPGFAGLTTINSFGSDEGGRYIIHRAGKRGVIDRMGEVLVNLPGLQLTVSDVDIVDPSVSGFFQSLYTIRIDGQLEDSGLTRVMLTYTMLGVAHPSALGALVHQANSIKRRAESHIDH